MKEGGKMIVAHNMLASNANRNLTQNLELLTKNTTKLSSGHKINKAADNVAGLTISEKMRAQIRGIEQASINGQDAISMVQVAEGAMNEIHSVLQRARELAVQCASDTYTDADRTNTNLEIEALMREVNKISGTTEFNTKKLLDGSLAATAGGGGTITNTYKQKLDGSATPFTLLDGHGIQIDYFDGTTNRTFTIKASNNWNPRDLKDGIMAAPGIGSTLGGIVNWVNTIYNNPGNKGGTLEAFLNEFTLSVDGANPEVLVAVAKNAGSSITGITVLPGTAMAVTTPMEIVTPVAATGDGVNIQIGPNSNHSIRFGINSMDTATLGLQAITVATSAGASGAITSIDVAIGMVSAERSGAGAVQNRLEYAIRNMNNYSENLTASESRIRDTDVGDEMVDYAKNSILLQVSQSMLAQANQSTENILQLLR